MTNLASRNSNLVLAAAVLVAGLTFAGGAFAQASNNNNGTGASVLPPAAPGTDGRQSTVTKGSPVNDIGTNRPNSSQPCEPGSSATDNSRTTTCMEPNGSKVTLPNEKGNNTK